MATLKTQGFQLSALPRAPNIPSNVGMVDIKAIDEGVRRGLANFEAIRQAPKSMMLADAQADAQTAQAPLRTRGILAQTEAAEQQLPLETAILAEKASPERMALERQALLNRSVKAPSGDVQLITALTNAQLRLQEDPNDAQAALIVASLKPIADRKGMAPVEAQNLRTADTNATRVATAAGADATRLATTGANIASREGIAERALSQGADLKREGLAQSEVNTRLTAQGRVDAARTANVNKAYQTAAEQNQAVQTSLGSLAVLEDKADAYLGSFLGSGPVVGSGPVLLARAVFGDPSGQQLKAAIGQEMTNAVKTVQGLGAMSNIEFNAVMEQLPKTTDVGSAMETKIEYLKAIRPWLSARSNLYMSELERGTSPVEAYRKVRTAFPVPPVAGAAELSSAPAPVTTQPQATSPVASQSSAVSPEERAAAAEWLAANPNDPRAPAVRAKAGL